MNPREKKLLVMLIAVVGVGFFGVGTWMWFVAPLKNYNKRIVEMQSENSKLQQEIDSFGRDRKKLMLARIKSLPATSNEASTEYVNYLHSVLPAAGLKVEEVNPGQNTSDVKPVTNIVGVKTTGHKTLTFQVKARGTLSQLISAIETMQKTPYEHRIKNLTVDRADGSPTEANPKLIVNMLIETLLVSKTTNKPGMPAGVDIKCVLADSMFAHFGGPTGLGQMAATLVARQAVPPLPNRRYDDISKRNIFAGPMREYPPPPKGKTPPPPPEYRPEPPPHFLKYIRLVGTETNRQEAHFLNLYYTKDEQRISAKENSGYNTFLIEARDRDYVFFLGKVLRVDQRAVFFQALDKVYQWNIGDTLDSAYASHLTLDILDTLDLEADKAWGQKELEKEKAKEKGTTKKNTKGGKVRPGGN